jgi:hypothetical protein
VVWDLAAEQAMPAGRPWAEPFNQTKCSATDGAQMKHGQLSREECEGILFLRLRFLCGLRASLEDLFLPICGLLQGSGLAINAKDRAILGEPQKRVRLNFSHEIRKDFECDERMAKSWN